MTVAGLLLAAGAGRRYGMPKALVREGGALLVERAVATLRDGGCAPVLVVLGAAADEVLATADLGDSTVVVNRDWATGMGSSLRAGLAALEEESAAPEAVCVLLVDTPGITSGAVRRVAGRAAPGALVMATYHGEPGHPVLLGRDHWNAVGELATGDVGARRYLARHPELVEDVPCEDVAVGDDVDVPR
ncbi:nucleotidyltransferase family protein [Rugosimonospora acidiphila]|uniref:Nucleotidyltransferase family protein n=1 Tax=Rugosimonospora acidiphila TaxID=556531 RepID=A0ABP9RYA7_9ACTN